MNSKFEITKEIFDLCQNFANDVTSSNIDKYESRNQSNVDKIKQDNRNGKIGEYAVYHELSKLYSNITLPDLSIYDKTKKSWTPDLQCEKFTVAVKTVEFASASRFGESWVFQYGDGQKDCDQEIFGTINPNSYVAFVWLNLDYMFGFIRGIVKVQWLHDNNLFKEMVKSNLKNKKAVYYSDLKKIGDLWQL